MSRYIDAEIALKTIDNYAKTVSTDGKVIVDAIRDIVGVITPTTDVVEVVRCKDCAYCRYVDNADIYKCDRRGYYSEEVKPTDYCSCGERREECKQK